ncbi:MAG: hypothetical protein AAFP19_14650 [Bacteroidota bacterium]
MTKIQIILNGLDDLDPKELEIVLASILKKIDQSKRVKNILDKYKGIGKGIWNVDAQEHTNQLRDGDRV